MSSDVNNQNDISHIIDNIYLGNVKGGTNLELLKELNIKAVVRILNPDNILMHRLRDITNNDDQNNGDQHNINYHYIDLYDHPHDYLIKYLNKFINFMEENKDKNILIHCMMGISRSASFTILYLIKKYFMTFDEAVKFVKDKRNIINPNGGFLYQIKKYHDTMFDT
jgi:protein-tyrosine phosphatase